MFVNFHYRGLIHLELYCTLIIEAWFKLNMHLDCRYVELWNACIVSKHTAPYAYSSGQSSMRTLPPHTAPTGQQLYAFRPPHNLPGSCMRRYGTYLQCIFILICIVLNVRDGMESKYSSISFLTTLYEYIIYMIMLYVFHRLWAL